MFWDVILGEKWSIPPWEVRENVTKLDIDRMGLWNGARNEAHRIATAQADAEAKFTQQRAQASRGSRRR